MLFWDTSALVPLLVRERYTEELRQLVVEDADMDVWWGSHVECVSALMRRVREEHLSADALAIAGKALELLAVRWSEVEPSALVRSRAERLLERYPLRAADAVQLGAALCWCNATPAGHSFVCLDRRLRDAASREGFELLPLALGPVPNQPTESH